ncbi:hypothetical protein GCM10009759_66050 [Kitasatospora saccharophila]|uniref:4-hydroxy-3-methylbut-2-enyl diphosphate reductase n=1 Tax=Kitasatospora saccharophila TaxID=407973 RepID=A0ABN2XZD7_9ACTN
MNRTRTTEAFDAAGPLLAAGLVRRGVPVHLAPWPGPLVGAPPTGASTGPRLVATTYVDVDGQVVGLAVVADPTLPALLDEAVAELRRWSDALRTRRLLLPVPAPACFPAPRAAGLLVLAQTRLPPRSACRAGRADATLAAYLERGDTVLVVGSGRGAWDDRPPRPSPRRAGVVPVASVRRATTVEVPAPAKLAFLQRPCTPVEELTAILDVLRSRFPLLRGQHPDQWCHRPTDTRDAVRSAAAASDLVLLVDDRHPHGRRPRHWLAHHRLVPVGSAADLDPVVLARAATITLTGPLHRPGTAALSTALARCLSGLGPLSVVRRRSTSETVTDVYSPPERSAVAAPGKP